MGFMYEKVTDLMTEIADIYDKICSPCSKDRIIFLDSIIRELNLEKEKMLDMACSTGETCTQLAYKGYNCMGIDLSSGMIAVAQSKAKNNKLQCEFKTMDMRKCEELNENFSLIYNNSLIWIDSIEGLKEVIFNVSKILKEDGIFIIDIPKHDKFLKNYRPFYANMSKFDKKVVYKISRYDDYPKTNASELRTSQTYVKLDYENNAEVTYSCDFNLRLHSIDEIRDILYMNNMEIAHIKGDYDKVSFEECNNIQIISRRRK